MGRRSALLPLLAFAPCALAAETGLSEKDFLGEVPVVASVSRLPQPLNEAPGAVTVIDRDTIRRSGAREIADLLRLVPGFQTAEVRGGNPVAAYHGTYFENANRIQVLIDGRSTYSPLYTGSASIGMRSVSLDDIERIEVLRGSNSATYGARAMFGVVNIITRESADTLGRTAHVAAGQGGLRDASARVGWGNEAAGFRLSAERRGDAGFSEFDRNRLGNVNFRGDLRASTVDTVEVRAGVSDQRWSDGFADQPTNAQRTRRYYGGYFQLDWRRSPSSDREFRLSYSHNEERYEDLYSARVPGLPAFPVDFSGAGRVDSLEFGHRFAAGPSVRVSWGGEWRSERLRSPPVYARSDWIDTSFARLSGNVEWRLDPKLILNAGAMFEHNSASGSAVLPRVMLNWLPAQGHAFRAGVSEAHRPPSVFERAANQALPIPGVGIAQNWLADPSVRPERLRAAELGYYGDWRSLRTSLDVRVFEERVEDFLQVIRVPVPAALGAINATTGAFANGRTMRLQGFEYQLAWRPTGSTRLTVAQSFVDANFPIDGDFISVPRNTGSVAWFQRLPGNWDMTLVHSHVSAMTWSGPGGLIPSHQRTDARLAHGFRLSGVRAEAALVAQSLGGATPEYLPQLSFGRRVFATLRLDFE